MNKKMTFKGDAKLLYIRVYVSKKKRKLDRQIASLFFGEANKKIRNTGYKFTF